jgi:ABC-type transport system involved in multi-copper enzyme maturation permease subunit
MDESTALKAPSFFQVVLAVGKVSFWEVVRDKILYNIVVVAAVLFFMGFLASKLTLGNPQRVILDLGLSSITITCSLIAVLTGARALLKEIESRTIYVALSRPITRVQFIFGKYVGISLVLVANWALLVAAYVGILSLTGEGLSSPSINMTFAWSLVLALMQSWLLASVAMFFSAFSTTSLAVMITFGLYLLGSNISQVRFIADQSKSPLSKMLLRSAAGVFPNFENFSLGTQVTYGLPVSPGFVGESLVYGVILILFFLLLAGACLQVKEV